MKIIRRAARVNGKSVNDVTLIDSRQIETLVADTELLESTNGEGKQLNDDDATSVAENADGITKLESFWKKETKQILNISKNSKNTNPNPTELSSQQNATISVFVILRSKKLRGISIFIWYTW